MYYAIFFLSVFISSVSQILLKKSANHATWVGFREYINPLVITAYIMFFGATFLTTFAFRGVPLQMGPIIETSGYFFVIYLGKLFLNERITKRKLLGTCGIICGIVICCFKG